jgi:hypothetical protein
MRKYFSASSSPAPGLKTLPYPAGTRHSTALTMSSTTFLASPKTIMVLSM